MKKRNPEYYEDIVSKVKADFDKRSEERRALEAQWQLNANFVEGNQYCFVAVSGAVEESEKEYFWQEREVFNHIASIMETRLAKLGSARPKFSVRPSSGDEADLKTAKVAEKILSSAYSSLGVDDILSRGTLWSELTGTVFYKVYWDAAGGKMLGETEEGKVREGDVIVEVCPPYEIYPSSLSAQTIEECDSIIHARVLSVDEIYRTWGVQVKPESVRTLSLGAIALRGGVNLVSASPRTSGAQAKNSAIVIERYSKPTAEKPDGELSIVASDKLLYHGPLPIVGIDGERGFPFVRQTSIETAGAFFGTCMVERCIPIQRAFNALKNRKHEFLNRISMGVLAVEDGSVDVNDLSEDGLSPGKILVYRQGSVPPRLLNPGSIPADFAEEEAKLLAEFVDVSGISEIMRSSSVPSSVTSGTAIQMLIDQDDTRISVTAHSIRQAAKKIAKMILSLYKIYATRHRVDKFVGDGGEVELLYWNASDLSSDDVIFSSESELNDTIASRRNTLFELMRSGLLSDKDGKLSESMKRKILDAFGYGTWEQTQYLSDLHIRRAEKENSTVCDAELKVGELDDHALHIDSHTRFALSSDFEELKAKHPDIEKKMVEHIRDHKRFAQAEELAPDAAKEAQA
jgi:hypothetical protein